VTPDFSPDYGPQEPETVVVEERMDTDVDFHNVREMSAFALALRDESYIRNYISQGQAAGYNTFRVLSETGGWRDNKIAWLPPGPPMNTKEAKDNLKRVLKVAAGFPNVWLEIVAGATERDNHKATRNWSSTVAKLCDGYRNVFINAINEPQMSNWTTRELNELMANIRNKCDRPVGVDQPAEGGHWKFDRGLKVDWRGMHPRRNPDLNQEELYNIARLNGLVLLNETTCYVSDENMRFFKEGNSLLIDEGRGTERERQRTTKKYMERVKKVRDLRWCFHSIDSIWCEKSSFWVCPYF
jgi:hypothetical protein